MAKRPTPKKRRAKSDGGAHYGQFQRRELARLTAKRNSPYAVRAERKNKASKSLKGITRIKA
jgi:hypothetical protein